MSDYDILIRGGTVIDGTMIPRFRADVGIKDGKVAKIGVNGKATADQVIDAGLAGGRSGQVLGRIWVKRVT